MSRNRGFADCYGTVLSDKDIRRISKIYVKKKSSLKQPWEAVFKKVQGSRKLAHLDFDEKSKLKALMHRIWVKNFFACYFFSNFVL